MKTKLYMQCTWSREKQYTGQSNIPAWIILKVDSNKIYFIQIANIFVQPNHAGFSKHAACTAIGELS